MNDEFDEGIQLKRQLAHLQNEVTLARSTLGAVLFGIDLTVAILPAALLLFVIPRFKRLYIEMMGDEPLPLLTRLLITGSDLSRDYLLLSLPALLLLCAALALVLLHPKVKLAVRASFGILWAGFCVGFCLVAVLGLFMPLLKLVEMLGT